MEPDRKTSEGQPRPEGEPRDGSHDRPRQPPQPLRPTGLSPPRARRSGGTSLLFLLALLLLAGGLAFWALREVPPATPHPSATALPDRMPDSPPPQPQS